jgi:lipid-A-disaccharide synthase
VAPTLDRDFIREQIGEQMGQLNFSVQLIKESPLEMIDLSDVVLVASGTATLMVGLMKKPMVIMYRMNALSAWIAKRVVTKTPFFGMVNLVLGRCAVPELFQEQASAQALATELSKLVADSEERAKMIQDLVELREKLGSAGATDRVARILDAYL